MWEHRGSAISVEIREHESGVGRSLLKIGPTPALGVPPLRGGRADL